MNVGNRKFCMRSIHFFDVYGNDIKNAWKLNKTQFSTKCFIQIVLKKKKIEVNMSEMCALKFNKNLRYKHVTNNIDP